MPLEKLQVRGGDTEEWRDVPIDETLDLAYKPGLYREVEAFLRGATDRFPTIQDQERALAWYEKIGGFVS